MGFNSKSIVANAGFVLAGLCGLAVPARAEVITLQGSLEARQVVDGGGSTSTATGFATLQINTGAATGALPATSMTLDFTWSGLSGPADRAHLHDAPAGVSRLVYDPFSAFFDEVFYNNNPLRTIDCPWGVLQPCVPAAGTLQFVQDIIADGIIDLSPGCDPTAEVCSMATLVSMAVNDIIYLDIHTQMFPSGELRGQLVQVPEPPALALLAVPLLWLGRRFLPRLARTHTGSNR
jgi:hypothetical protein